MDQLGNKILVFETKPDGTFAFKYENHTSMVLLAYRDDKKAVSIRKRALTAGQYVNHSINKNVESKDIPKAFAQIEKPLEGKIEEKAAVVSLNLKEDSAQLDEIVIVGYGTMRKQMVAGAVTTIQSESIVNNDNIIQALQGRVAGVQISRGSGQLGSDATIRIRGVGSVVGNNEPLYIVDGVPVSQHTFGNFDVSQVQSVSVLKDVAATAIYGSRGSNGVILISTHTGNYINNQGKKRLNNAKFNNYAVEPYYNYSPAQTYTPKTFYVPKYDSKSIPEERTDFRKTIYWNPVVQTDEFGKAELEFYNSDAITSFKITAEGIGFNGTIGRKVKNYATKKLLNVDFKSPNYMVLEDTVLLPITISNDTDAAIEADLELILPEHLKRVGDFEKHITIPANGSVFKTVAVVPLKKSEKSMVEIRVHSENLSDVVKKEVTILSPYFPVATSISGSKSQAFEFEINDLVDGSLHAEFDLYTDVIGDVMNGIESLIREPYGCFEQTSSSTYPNIMVLQYLKETGKNNPEIETKALDFIDRGYKRLISFETKENGFEWFGHTPPHETLTAYGILEFTEMKQVYNGVDQAMIDRTVAWLMSRKDGKGGFNKSEKGYDSFASSPADVANAYIVYAITEAGIDADLNLEYRTALREAIHTNDSYKMAMLALASDNLNMPANYEVLLKKLKSNISEYDFEKLPVENTITRSYGNAKNIETVAFTLLALMRETNPDRALITKGIQYLVNKREHNRFGSTQSTAMALKALINYTKNQKEKILESNDTVELTINGNKISKNLNDATNGNLSIADLQSYLKEGKQRVEIRFKNENNAYPYSLNVGWDSYLPNSSSESPLRFSTKISEIAHQVGDNVSMSIELKNTQNNGLGMVTSIIGIPSGTTAQPWQLKELLEQEKVAYYEVFDNYLVLYWRSFEPTETKTIRLDLKADIAGSYQAPASTAYLYYGDEHKTWIKGNAIEITN